MLLKYQAPDSIYVYFNGLRVFDSDFNKQKNLIGTSNIGYRII